MGLAASQAQLLSITSRMSDNELRGQLITNAKMRLAAESGQVSDSYITALNEAKMMFTNYGPDNSQQYTDLTFNSMTQYNQFNNQYGLSTMSGNLLVSEQDASNYKASLAYGPNALNKFLEANGLTYTTTFWNNLAVNGSNIPYQGVDDFGMTARVLSGYSAADLQAIYDGEKTADGVSHIGYNAALSDPAFFSYSNLINDYDSSQADLALALKTAISGKSGDYVSGYINQLQPTEGPANGNQYVTLGEIMWGAVNGFVDHGTATNGSFQANTPADTGTNGTDAFNNLKKILKELQDGLGSSTSVIQTHDTSGGPANDFLSAIWIQMDDFFAQRTYLNPSLSTDNSTAYMNLPFLADMRNNLTYDSYDVKLVKVSDGNTPPNYTYQPQFVKVNDDGTYTTVMTNDIPPVPATSLTVNEVYTDTDGYMYADGHKGDSNYKITPETNEDDNGTGNLKVGNTVYSQVSDGNGGTIYKDSQGNQLNFAYNTVTYTLPTTPITPGTDGSFSFNINSAIGTASAAPAYTINTSAWTGSTPPKANAEDINHGKTNLNNADFINFLPGIVSALQQYFANQIDLNAFYSQKIAGSAGPNNQPIKDAYTAYKKNAIDLIKLIFGDGNELNSSGTTTGITDTSPFVQFKTNYGFTITGDMLANLSDPDWIRGQYKELADKYKQNGTEPDAAKYAALQKAQAKFQPVLDVDILEKIMDTYGEPVYCWVDKNGENGDKKAEWYTNLFNRMQQGYQALEDGLASSPEWINYALQSGLVVMEQVDSSRTWNKFTYTNCSDITEQTDNVAVTKAEAEYNRAMNKIQTKDKQYDLELKNIDTEHSSLQTEYDSIKAAIDKNVERNFKMYS